VLRGFSVRLDKARDCLCALTRERISFSMASKVVGLSSGLSLFLLLAIVKLARTKKINTIIQLDLFMTGRFDYDTI